MADRTDDEAAPRKKTAGAFDIRNVIGGLMALYGIVLVPMGLFADQELDKTGGVNANLWTGIALLLVALFFMVWARLRPIVVPVDNASDAAGDDESDTPGADMRDTKHASPRAGRTLGG